MPDQQSPVRPDLFCVSRTSVAYGIGILCVVATSVTGVVSGVVSKLYSDQKENYVARITAADARYARLSAARDHTVDQLERERDAFRRLAVASVLNLETAADRVRAFQEVTGPILVPQPQSTQATSGTTPDVLRTRLDEASQFLGLPPVLPP